MHGDGLSTTAPTATEMTRRVIVDLLKDYSEKERNEWEKMYDEKVETRRARRRQYAKKWRLDNRERIKANNQRYYQKCKKKVPE